MSDLCSRCRDFKHLSHLDKAICAKCEQHVEEQIKRNLDLAQFFVIEIQSMFRFEHIHKEE